MGTKCRSAILVLAAAASAHGVQPTPLPGPRSPLAPQVLPQSRAAVAELTELLRASILEADPQRRDRTISGLRTVRDPAMLPFFAQLSINQAPQLRVHGLLGLAELEPRRGLDLLAASRISDPRLQGIVVSEAVSEGLVSDDARSELTTWSSLPVRTRLDLAADCAGADRPFDVVFLQKQLGAADAYTAVAAALVLRQARTAVSAADQTIRTRTAGLGAGSGDSAGELAGFVMAHSLTDADQTMEILAGVLKPGANADAVMAARLLTSPESPAAVSDASRRLDVAVPVGQRRAFAVQVLEGALRLGKLTPVALLDEMASDPDPLIKAMAAAGRAISKDAGVDQAAGALARTGDLPSVAWSLRCAGERHWQDARAIRLAVLAGIGQRPRGAAVDPRLASLGVRAAASLCDDDPRALDRPLAEAMSASDDALTRIILEGALRSGNADAGALARQGSFDARPQGPWPTRPAAAVALLVAVRHNEFTADPSERVARLSAIARGEGGGLGVVLRTQAAWMALRESGEHRVALTRILSDLPAPATDTPVQAEPATPAPQRNP